MEFDEKTVAKCLSLESNKLRAAGIRNIWIDMSGSGWTNDYKVIIDAATSTQTTVRHGIENIIYHRLISDTIKVVSSILNQIQLDEHLCLDYMCSQNSTYQDIHMLVWPAKTRREYLEKKINNLQIEADRWKALEN